MLEGKKIGEIKKAIKHNKWLAEEPKGGYNRTENEWGSYDSSIEIFANTYFYCLPEKYREYKEEKDGFLKYIEETLSTKERKDSFSAVEFGGPGSQLFRGFIEKFFEKTVGICLKDIRDKKTKQDDKSIHHSVIAGDILDVRSDQLFNKITETLGKEKTDLIISRMNLALDYIDKNPAILDRVIRNWYKMLNENGLMFIQFEYSGTNEITKQIIRKWVTAIEEKYPEIDIQAGNLALRLHKKIGAPEELPSAKKLFS